MHNYIHNDNDATCLNTLLLKQFYYETHLKIVKVYGISDVIILFKTWYDDIQMEFLFYSKQKYVKLVFVTELFKELRVVLWKVAWYTFIAAILWRYTILQFVVDYNVEIITLFKTVYSMTHLRPQISRFEHVTYSFDMHFVIRSLMTFPQEFSFEIWWR